MKNKNIFLSLFALLLSTAVHAYDFESDDIFYTIVDSLNRKVEVDGCKTTSLFGKVTIPSEVSLNGETYVVTGIGSSAFYDDTDLLSIVLPQTIARIEDHAFAYCESLEYVSIPDSLSYIGYNAFGGTPWMEKLGEGLIYLGKVLFKYNGAMPSNTSIDIREGTTCICEGAFYEYGELVSVSIPPSVTSIGPGAFCGCCNLTSVLFSESVPSSVTSIGFAAFQDCISLTSFFIPESVAEIGLIVFSGCTSLEIVTGATNVTFIGLSAFEETPWLNNYPEGYVYIGHVLYMYKGELPQNTSLVIEEGTTCIGAHAFKECEGLVSLTIPHSVQSIGEEAFFMCVNLTSINIPYGVTDIYSDAFFGCESATSLYISETVRNIEGDWWYGCNPFQGCTSLQEIRVAEGNEIFDSRNNCNAIIVTKTGELMSGCNNTVIPEDVKEIGAAAFFGCDSLTFVIIPEGVTDIGMDAFANDSLKIVVIPSSVTHIGEGAFGGENLIVILCTADPSTMYVYDSFPYWDVTYYVPSGSKALYEGDLPWMYSKAIIEYDSLDELLTGIDKPLVAGTEYDIIYDFQGRRILSKKDMKNGLYVINGKKAVVM